MPYTRLSLQEIIDRVISDFENRVEDSKTFLRRSVFKIFARVFGGSHHLIYDYIEFVKDQLFITTADAEHLERHGAEYGIYKNYGDKATGTAEATGTVGVVVPSGSELQSSTGNLYVTDADYTIGGAGTVSMSLTAKETGTEYNEEVGVVLTFVSPISGINTNATITGNGITSGVNEDTKEQYRTRILNRKRQPPHGGAEQDYIDWALEYSGSVTRAWAIPLYQGLGTIGLAFVEDDEDSIYPDETTREALKAWIISHLDEGTGKTVGIPVTAEEGFFIIALTPYTVNFTIEIYPNTSAVQSAITTKIEELFLQEGGPGETIYLSEVYEAITSAVGEERSKITYPTIDITAPTNQLHEVGTITFEDYT